MSRIGSEKQDILINFGMDVLQLGFTYEEAKHEQAKLREDRKLKAKDGSLRQGAKDRLVVLADCARDRAQDAKDASDHMARAEFCNNDCIDDCSENCNTDMT